MPRNGDPAQNPTFTVVTQFALVGRMMICREVMTLTADPVVD